MVASSALQKFYDLNGINLGPMIVFSAFVHIVVFFALFLLPESIPSPRLGGRVYEVNLVDMPSNNGRAQPVGKPEKTAPRLDKSKPVYKLTTKTKRIKTPVKKAKPLVIAKRTSKKKTTKSRKKEPSSSQLIERAISRIKKSTDSKNTDSKSNNHVDRAIADLVKKHNAGSNGSGRVVTGSGGLGGRGAGGMLMQIYQLEAETWIKNNWSYPAALDKKSRNLEAVIVLLVKKDGAIVKTSFERKSRNSLFDESVVRAVEKSDPLPPFPEGYRKSHDEFVITFNLKDLEN